MGSGSLNVDELIIHVLFFCDHSRIHLFKGTLYARLAKLAMLRSYPVLFMLIHIIFGVEPKNYP